MIVRVVIENLVIVERAEFEPGRGLTAITGETGAGKTLLATAVALLFGGDADAGQVGPAGEQAWVEGEFEPHAGFWAQPEVAALAELRPEPDAPLVLARRVDANGRSRAMAWGRTVAKTDLAAAGKLLLATAGQHVQVRLRSAEYQRGALDEAGGAAQVELLAEMRTAWEQLAAARAEHQRLEQLAADGLARADQLRDDLARIDAVAPSLEDETELRGARDRARHHASLVEAVARTSATLDGGGDGGAIDLVGRAYATLSEVAELDPSLGEASQSLLAVQETLGEIASGLSSRMDGLSEGPGSLDDIEDRLSAYDELHRRFGGTTEGVLATWASLREQVDAIDDTGGALAASGKRRDSAQAAAVAVAERLTAARCALADQLAGDVHDCLAELGMASSVFRVEVADSELAALGADRIAFLLAPAEGIEPRPVAQVASGGELSRIALALLVATAGASDADSGIGTILFDEIDAGIGGHTAHAVASLLRRLADQRQVLCITHLPQVAARADTHVVIDKSAAAGTTRTTLHTLAGEPAVLDELVRMLGADHDDAAAREHATQLRGPRFGLRRGGAPASEEVR